MYAKAEPAFTLPALLAPLRFTAETPENIPILPHPGISPADLHNVLGDAEEEEGECL